MSDKQQPETQSKSGLILKAAREEMSLSLEEVAHELHLRPSVVKAIEEENYDEFYSDVFLKGYFRSYCRIVNLHDERMMDLLDQQLLARRQKAEQAQSKANKIILTKKRKRLLTTLIIFCTCLSLVGLSYYIATKDSSYSASKKEENSQPKVDDLNVKSKQMSSESTDASSVTMESEPPLFNKAQIITTQEQIESSELTETNTPLSVKISNSTEQSSATIQEVKPNKLTDDTIAINEPVNVESTLTAKFSGACWFKLTDGAGQVVIAELKNKDDDVNFSGIAPFHIIIGDANKVILSLNQELIDLSPYTSTNGRAELTLNPPIPANEG